ncbi:hypothetical protein TNCV_3436871 [Trichonephila clavipes]|nr:hypothetical protein TNCV_3436871 [Trichonephila clavipes]
MSGKKRSLQEAWDLLQNLPSKSNDTLTDVSSAEEVTKNNVLEFLSDSKADDQETEQDLGCNSSCSKKAVLTTPGCKLYTRAFGDGPRNFEPWASDVDDT